MNQRVKKLWLAALRSGEYVRGHGRLLTVNSKEHDYDQFCCLGVLTDLYLRENSDGWSRTWEVGEHGCDAELSEPVRRWAGLSARAPMAGGTCLIWANDQGMAFVQIADLIEKHL